MDKTKELVEQIKKYFGEHPERYTEEVDTLLADIYSVYTERKAVEDKNVKDAYMSLHRCLCMEVGDKKADHYMDMVGTVCCEYERVSFIEGMRVGARLMMELIGEQ